ncbi:MAG: hypothetical protein AB7N76_03435 [Planctomycetota bacterium]
MHILAGALAGAAFAVVAVAVVALVTRKPTTAKALLLAALGGAVAGAVTTATLGASSGVAVGLGKEVAAFAMGGAAGGGSERLADNALEGRPLTDHLATSTAVGAGVGLVSLGSGKALRAVGERVFPALTRMADSGSHSFAKKLLGASTPGTGGSWLRGSGRVPGTGSGLFRSMTEGRERRARERAAGAQPTPEEEADERAPEAPLAVRRGPRPPPAQETRSRGLSQALGTLK